MELAGGESARAGAWRSARRRRLARVVSWPPALLLVLAVAPRGRAESVPIGRYVELRAGAGVGHVYAASGGDAGRTGRSPVRAPSNPPALSWRLTLPTKRLLPPAVRADGMLILGSESGVQAISPDGSVRWSTSIGAVRYTPALGPEGQSVAVARGKLFVLDADGRPSELALPAPATTAPLLLDSGVIVVGASDGHAHLLGLDGRYIGAVALPLPAPIWTAWLGEGSALLAGRSPLLSLISPYGGTTRTLRVPGALAVGPVASGDGGLWAIGRRGTLWRLSALGAVHELAELGPGEVTLQPSLGHDGALRVGLRHGEIACYDARGEQRWRRGIDGPPSALLLDVDDTALLVSARATLYAIDRRGELRWRTRTDLVGGGRPVLGPDGTVYLIGRGGKLEAWQ